MFFILFFSASLLNFSDYGFGSVFVSGGGNCASVEMSTQAVFDLLKHANIDNSQLVFLDAKDLEEHDISRRGIY